MRLSSRLLFLALALFVVAAPAWAADAHGGEAKPGLLDVDMWTAITAIVVFLILLAVLGKFAWKPILAGMKTREERIASALDEAEKANVRARELIAEYESRLDQAREEAASIAEEARKDARDIKAQIEADGRRAADETVARARIEIEQITATAWDKLVRDAAGIASEAAGKIIGRELSPEAHAALVAEVVGEYAAKRRGGKA
ncbi:MAG: F0F1 ATP synthase subunit B [Planctomycetota bacterium]